MRRFSLGRLMVVVALFAANLALLHYLLEPSSSGIPEMKVLLAGLLPLADAVLIAVWRLATRWRVSVRWRPRGEKGGFVGWFAVTCALILTALLAATLCWPAPLMGYVNWSATPLERAFRDSGIDLSNDAVVYGVLPVFLFVVVSGPPLLVSLIASLGLSRFRLVVTPRVPPCAASASSA